MRTVYVLTSSGKAKMKSAKSNEQLLSGIDFWAGTLISENSIADILTVQVSPYQTFVSPRSDVLFSLPTLE